MLKTEEHPSKGLLLKTEEHPSKEFTLPEFYELYNTLNKLISAVNKEDWKGTLRMSIEFENTVSMMLTLVGGMNNLEDDFKRLRYAIMYTPEWVRKRAVKEKLSRLMVKLSRCGLGYYVYEVELGEDGAQGLVESIYFSTKWLDKLLMQLSFQLDELKKGRHTLKGMSITMLIKMYADKILNELMKIESEIPEVNSIALEMKNAVDELTATLNNLGQDQSYKMLSVVMTKMLSLSRAMYEIVHRPEIAGVVKESLEKNLGVTLPVFEVTTKQETRVQPPVRPGSFDWVDDEWKTVLKHPFTFVILGQRGEGKSQLGHTLLEYYASTYNLDAYFFSPFGKDIVYNRVKNLPGWIKVVDKLGEIGTDCVVLFDEFHNVAHARRGMAHEAVTVDRMIELSRQNDQTHIFVTQRSTKLDRNIIMSDATLLIKKPSMIQVSFERQELRDILLEAHDEFRKLEKTLSNEDERKSYVYVVCEEFAQGNKFGKMKRHGMASYWSEDLSKVFRGV